MATAPRFADLIAEYHSDWAAMTHAGAEALRAADQMAVRLEGEVHRYRAVEAATGVPWWMVGLLHMRESTFDFATHLHNGDPLTRRTVQVPAGRPVSGRTPFTWEESAIDALRYDRLDRVGSWPVEVVAYRGEAYNGWGPRWRGCKSGYLWAGSSIYTGGKYVRDGVWDPTARDKQIGIMPVLRRLMVRGAVRLPIPSIAIAAKARTPEDLQRALNVALAHVPGWEPLRVDGSIGRVTRDAIRAFQRLHGLADDGEAGALTWVAIDAALSKS